MQPWVQVHPSLVALALALGLALGLALPLAFARACALPLAQWDATEEEQRAKTLGGNRTWSKADVPAEPLTSSRCAARVPSLRAAPQPPDRRHEGRHFRRPTAAAACLTRAEPTAFALYYLPLASDCLGAYR